MLLPGFIVLDRLAYRLIIFEALKFTVNAVVDGDHLIFFAVRVSSQQNTKQN